MHLPRSKTHGKGTKQGLLDTTTPAARKSTEYDDHSGQNRKEFTANNDLSK